tara:strand:+ start:12040 stop:12243 length:204 start_codon:yes stop_codon:yes gene_type:complete
MTSEGVGIERESKDNAGKGNQQRRFFDGLERFKQFENNEQGLQFLSKHPIKRRASQVQVTSFMEGDV